MNAVVKARDAGQGKIWWARLLNKPLQYGLDFAVLVAAFILAYLLRFDFDIPIPWLMYMLLQGPFVVLLQFAALRFVGAHSFVWRYVGIAETKAFVLAAMYSGGITGTLWLVIPTQYPQWRVPLSITVIDTAFAFGGIVALRVVRRTFYEKYEKYKRRRANGTSVPKKRVLFIGAGRAGLLAAKEIESRGDSDIDLKGFVDDDVDKHNTVIHTFKVLGSTQDLIWLVKKHRIQQVVITIHHASGSDIRRIIQICEKIPVPVRIMPDLTDILQGRVAINRIRELQIEDLLRREPIQLNEDEIEEFLTNKCVVVTGAGGSIGSELCRQVAKYNPSVLVLVERAEFALFTIDRELREAHPNLTICPEVADVGDETRIRTILSHYEPQIIVHAAAHKHVPMMELNPSAAIKNNTLATSILARIAGEFGVAAFVMISTDKAVHPTSIMGASKRIAELIVQDLSRHFPTRYVVVRFGNVIGSAGSVIPIFQEQIRKGGPITVTHPEMMRYFMTIPEAAQLVLQASAMGEGGEIFILDMGLPIRILDLAVDAITLSGLKPYEDIQIKFTGIRPGEKLFEELQTQSEAVGKTRHPKILIGKITQYPEEHLRHGLERLASLCRNGSDRELRAFLQEFLPEAKLTTIPEVKPETTEVRLAMKSGSSGAG